ncbi:MAG: ribonuclease HI family protein [Planctomycetes bacterium]|jgi:ribonuclease HI|nr:ribonuclease HI family protein [Planctomycetota bacterium]
MAQASLKVIVNIDGGARGNPGPAAAGFVLRTTDGTVLCQRGCYLGQATNNVAEYTALLKALAAAAELKATDIQIFSDSELLVRQMNGQYRVKNAGLLELFIKAKDMASGFESCTISHVRREMNSHADRMVNLALDRRQDVQD